MTLNPPILLAKSQSSNDPQNLMSLIEFARLVTKTYHNMQVYNYTRNVKVSKYIFSLTKKTYFNFSSCSSITQLILYL